MLAKYACHVCGLLQDSPPWGEDGETPLFEICACCGVEFGYGDATIIAVHRTRDRWLEKGAKWFMPKFKPIDWSLGRQLAQIPEMFKQIMCTLPA